LRHPDVPVLRFLVSASQQDDDHSFSPGEINPVTGPTSNPQFRNTFTNRTNITWMSRCETFNTGKDASAPTDVPQAINPLSIRFRLANFEHSSSVSNRIQFVKNFEFGVSKNVRHAAIRAIVAVIDTLVDLGADVDALTTTCAVRDH